MLKEDEFAVRLEDPAYTLNRLHHARNRTQRKRAHNCIDACVSQRNAFSGQIEKLDLYPRSPPLFLCAPKHPRIGFESIDLAHPRGVVVSEVDAGTHADLKDTPLGQWDDAPSNVFDRFRVSQYAYEIRIDMVFVERHTCSMRYASPTGCVPHCSRPKIS